MKGMIEELWHGNVCPQSDSRNNSSEMKQLMEYMSRHHEDLLKTMTDNQKEIFEKFDDCWSEYASHAEEAMAAFCNQFDKICAETGCATIYCHHHSKGAQGGKRAIDRASGSGVFARDPDAQLDMIQLELDDDLSNNVRDGNSTAWRMESSLREFENFKPINFWFEYPIHRLDNSNLEKANAEGSPLANLSKSSKRTTKEERRNSIDTAFDICAENGFTRVSDLAEYTGLDEKTIRRYLGEFDDAYDNDRGIVTRKKST